VKFAYCFFLDWLDFLFGDHHQEEGFGNVARGRVLCFCLMMLLFLTHSVVGVFFGFVAFIFVIIGYSLSAWLNSTSLAGLWNCSAGGFVSAYLWQLCCHDCTSHNTILPGDTNWCDSSLVNFGGNNKCVDMKDNTGTKPLPVSDNQKTARAFGAITVAAVFFAFLFQIAYHFRAGFKIPCAILKLAAIVCGLICVGAFAGDDGVKNYRENYNFNYSYSFGLFCAGWLIELIALVFIFLC